MALLYEAQQKDPFIRHLIQTYVKVPREDWPPPPPAGECTPEALAFYKALPHLLVTSTQDPYMPADILAYKKEFIAPPALGRRSSPLLMAASSVYRGVPVLRAPPFFRTPFLFSPPPLFRCPPNPYHVPS